jgi:hypothetical protein
MVPIQAGRVGRGLAGELWRNVLISWVVPASAGQVLSLRAVHSKRVQHADTLDTRRGVAPCHERVRDSYGGHPIAGCIARAEVGRATDQRCGWELQAHVLLRSMAVQSAVDDLL